MTPLFKLFGCGCNLRITAIFRHICYPSQCAYSYNWPNHTYITVNIVSIFNLVICAPSITYKILKCVPPFLKTISLHLPKHYRYCLFCLQDCCHNMQTYFCLTIPVRFAHSRLHSRTCRLRENNSVI